MPCLALRLLRGNRQDLRHGPPPLAGDPVLLSAAEQSCCYSVTRGVPDDGLARSTCSGGLPPCTSVTCASAAYSPCTPAGPRPPRRRSAGSTARRGSSPSMPASPPFPSTSLAHLVASPSATPSGRTTSCLPTSSRGRATSLPLPRLRRSTAPAPTRRGAGGADACVSRA